VDGGKYWKELGKGLPTIAVRDIEIQKRENDLVLATFGRGFYIMDDYSALREFSRDVQESEAHLFSVRYAYQYMPYSRIAASETISWLGPKGFQGEDYFMGENPEFGAAFTWYLKEDIKTKKELREAEEAESREAGKTVYYPSYEQLKAEAEEEKPFLIFTVRDSNGEVVRELTSSPKAGINRIYWDLKYPRVDEISDGDSDPSKELDSGIMVLPGRYSVELSKSVNGSINQLAGPVSFEVRTLGNVTLPAENPDEMLAYHKELMDLSKSANSARSAYNELNDRLNYYKAALKAVNDEVSLAEKVSVMEEDLKEIRKVMFGDRIASQLELPQAPSLNSRINTAIGSGLSSTSDPTETSRRVKAIAEKELKPVLQSLHDIMNRQVPAIDRQLNELNAPWTPGRIIELDEG
jgi:hypothetical protein